MAALVATNGILTIQNTTDTFTPNDGGANRVLPVAAILTSSAASHCVLQDAQGVTILDLYAAATANTLLDSHFFHGMTPWKAPIKCSTLTGGGKLRLYGM